MNLSQMSVKFKVINFCIVSHNPLFLPPLAFFLLIFAPFGWNCTRALFYNMFFIWNKKYKSHQTNHYVAKINKCQAINCLSIYSLVYLFQTEISIAHQVRCIIWALHLRLHLSKLFQGAYSLRFLISFSKEIANLCDKDSVYQWFSLSEIHFFLI